MALEFQKELPKSGVCSVASFFGSGTLIMDGCGMKITDFLRDRKGALDDIERKLATTLSYYAGIESLGNPIFDEKLQKNMQSLL